MRWSPPRAAIPLLGAAAVASAGVTIITGADPKPWSGTAAVSSADDFFRASIKGEFTQPDTEVLMSSLDATDLSAADHGLQPSADSFLRGAIQAWGEHHHLMIRPEEVWFTILVQLNFYMGTHAEEVRDLFVNHEGRETILVEDYTWMLVLERFQYEIQDRVKTDWLLEWIQPNFTTTTDSDRMTANVLMMGLMKQYFNYEGSIICGLPSVTLLGTKEDWQSLYDRLEHLPDFGAEPEAYQRRLRPILSRFVASFDDPDSKEIISFWNSIVVAESTHICGDPPYYINGWLTGFWYWDANGEEFARNDRGIADLDGVTYARVSIEDLPIGYAQAPFIMRDFKGVERFEAMVLAGTVGKSITEGYPEGYVEAYERAGGEGLEEDPAQHSTLQPGSGWLLYGPVSHDRNATIPENVELGQLPDYLDSSKGCGVVGVGSDN
ncbi:uncharacterized protein DNG_03508 [Cephalotrichum gorgonifer]|uniref:Uncharacterized protein n=1 Tax=Cephalotrichum gorgonifer TaxID=2041049 RepID=A0AAE8MX53_9PEZI|nr:uncharacterized protein DNG_03508 [Cephalotrichum gorgonifer]